MEGKRLSGVRPNGTASPQRKQFQYGINFKQWTAEWLSLVRAFYQVQRNSSRKNPGFPDPAPGRRLGVNGSA